MFGWTISHRELLLQSEQSKMVSGLWQKGISNWPDDTLSLLRSPLKTSASKLNHRRNDS